MFVTDAAQHQRDKFWTGPAHNFHIAYVIPQSFGFVSKDKVSSMESTIVFEL
jgi:hypothetical protein